ncbi:hypothetical protein Droror1_Dr00016515 [Drosera rotundifolia]
MHLFALTHHHTPQNTNQKYQTKKSSTMRNPSTTTKNTTATTTTTASKTGLKRGPWTPEEDEILTRYIEKEGEGKWRTMPRKAGLARCGKSCRLRWMNYLRPELKRGGIGWDEEEMIVRLHRLLGNRWSLIAGRIPGRTDNEIKNYWNTHISKKLIGQGIDPRTHKPLINYPDHSNSTNSNFTYVPTLAYHPDPPRPNLEDHVTYHNSSRALLHENFSLTSYVEGRAQGDKKVLGVTQDASNSILFHPIDNVESCRNTSWQMASHEKAEDLNNKDILNTGHRRQNGYEMTTMTNNIFWGINDEVRVHAGFDYGKEDPFSSFLNSLTNEDSFSNEQQHQQHQPTTYSMPQDSMSYYLAQTPLAWDSMMAPSFTFATFPTMEMHDSRIRSTTTCFKNKGQ